MTMTLWALVSIITYRVACGPHTASSELNSIVMIMTYNIVVKSHAVIDLCLVRMELINVSLITSYFLQHGQANVHSGSPEPPG